MVNRKKRVQSHVNMYIEDFKSFLGPLFFNLLKNIQKYHIVLVKIHKNKIWIDINKISSQLIVSYCFFFQL